LIQIAATATKCEDNVRNVSLKGNSNLLRTGVWAKHGVSCVSYMPEMTLPSIILA